MDLDYYYDLFDYSHPIHLSPIGCDGSVLEVSDTHFDNIPK